MLLLTWIAVAELCYFRCFPLICAASVDLFFIGLVLFSLTCTALVAMTDISYFRCHEKEMLLPT
jgi:hypothetical protein